MDNDMELFDVFGEGNSSLTPGTAREKLSNNSVQKSEVIWCCCNSDQFSLDS